MASNYIRDNGVSDEMCFPFQNDSSISCSEKCTNPNEVISFQSYSNVNLNAQSIKYNLINKGPLVSGISHNYLGQTIDGRDSIKYCGHCMSMVGYGVVSVGDTITYIPSYPSQYCTIDSIIHTGDDLIGKTYWIFKNSYGSVNRPNGGYMYAIFPQNGDNVNNISTTYSLNVPISSNIYSGNDILITDDDNDGYYFWGLGPKPANCPVCCPDAPDGDDSNPNLGEMDSYGNFLPYSFPYPTDTIFTTQTWNTNRQSCNNVVVTNNATLTITATFTMNPAAKIIVKSGSSLVVNGGTIVYSNVVIENGGTLIMQNNAVMNTKEKGNIQIKYGGIFNMDDDSSIIIE